MLCSCTQRKVAAYFVGVVVGTAACAAVIGVLRLATG